MDLDGAIITHTHTERVIAMVLKEGADGRGVGHILSYIKLYHIIDMETNLRLIET
jgi:hypothetical protein